MSIKVKLVGSYFLMMGVIFSSQADPAPVIVAPSNTANALKVADGFKVEELAYLERFGSPRFMAVDSKGSLFVTLSSAGKVLKISNPWSKESLKIETVFTKLENPHGIAFDKEGQIYIGELTKISKARLNKDGTFSELSPIVTGLPPGGHSLKSLKIGPDGFLYVTVGSTCNVCIESDPRRATIMKFDLAGNPVKISGLPEGVFATGLRNSESYAWHPVTGQMFATNNGADQRSLIKGGPENDSLPPEHLNLIKEGKNYGWPHCWGNHVKDVNFEAPNADFCDKATPPALELPSHNAPLGITFLDKAKVPKSFKNDALIALHGSWNKAKPDGYKVIKVSYDSKSNMPLSYSDFLTGWLGSTGTWGRPVDVAVGIKGEIYVSDDTSLRIFKITPK